MKRVNQRTVNKKTLESLIYAGAFDAFPQLHRAQYFCVPQGETTMGLKRSSNMVILYRHKTAIQPILYLVTLPRCWI